MDRRKFLGTATLAGIPVTSTSAVAQALGQPASLTNGQMTIPADGMLSISISDAAIPAPLREITRAMMNFFIDLGNNQSLARELGRDPTGLLAKYGLDRYISPDDPLLDAVSMVADPYMNNLMKSADYQTFMSQLEASGVLKPISKIKLRDYYVAILLKDQEQFNRFLKGVFDANLQIIPDAQARSARVNRIIDLLNTRKPPPTGSTPSPSLEVEPPYNPEPGYVDGGFAAVSVAWIAISVYTYVFVVSQAAIALNVAAGVTAYVYLAVKVFAGEEGDGGYLSITSPSTTKIMDDTVRNVQRLTLAASLHGRKDLALEGIKESINKELDALIDAAEQVGLLQLPKQNKRQIVKEMKQLCAETIGL